MLGRRAGLDGFADGSETLQCRFHTNAPFDFDIGALLFILRSATNFDTAYTYYFIYKMMRMPLLRDNSLLPPMRHFFTKLRLHARRYIKCNCYKAT